MSELINNHEIPININELKMGDKITVEETSDLTMKCSNDACVKKIKIVKL